MRHPVTMTAMHHDTVADRRTEVIAGALPTSPGQPPDRAAVERLAPPPGRYLVLSERGEPRLIGLDGAGEPLHLGRSFAADLQLDDPGVSRRHAIVVARPGGARVLDDRSANGTYVNGRRVAEADLHDGDVIVVGRVALEYVEIAG